MGGRSEPLVQQVIEALSLIREPYTLKRDLESIARLPHRITLPIARAFANHRDLDAASEALSVLARSREPADHAQVTDALQRREPRLVGLLVLKLGSSQSLRGEDPPSADLMHMIDADVLDRIEKSISRFEDRSHGFVVAVHESFARLLRECGFQTRARDYLVAYICEKPRSTVKLSPVKSLLEWGGPEAREAICRLGQQWPEGRGLLGGLLAEIGDPRGLAWYIESTDEARGGQDHLKVSRLEKMGRSLDSAAIRAVALQYFKPGSPYFRDAAILLAQQPAPEQEQTFLDLLGTTDYHLSGAAATALANLGTPAARRRLVEAAGVLGNYENAHSIVDQLGRLPGDDITEVLLAVAQKGGDSFHREAAVKALASRRGENVLNILCKLARKGPRSLRNDALRAIGNRGDPAAIPTVIEALSEEDEYAFLEAVTALLKMKAWDALPMIKSELHRFEPMHLEGRVPDDAEIPADFLVMFSFTFWIFGWSHLEQGPGPIEIVVNRIKSTGLRAKALLIGKECRWGHLSYSVPYKDDPAGPVLVSLFKETIAEYTGLRTALWYSDSLRDEGMAEQILDFFILGTIPEDPERLALTLLDFIEGSHRPKALDSKELQKDSAAFLTDWLKRCGAESLGRALPGIVRALESPVPAVVKIAAQLLKVVGRRDPSSLVPQLDYVVELAFHESPAIGSEAIKIVKIIVLKGKVDPTLCLPRLAPLLDSPTSTVKVALLSLLKSLGPETLLREREILERLQAVASSPGEADQVRKEAAQILAPLGVAVTAPDPMARLVADSSNASARVRKQAAARLATLQPPPREILTAVLRGLMTTLPESESTLWVARAFGREPTIGLKLKEEHSLVILGDCLRALKDPARRDWLVALQALWQSEMDPTAREALAFLFGRLKMEEAVPVLVDALALSAPHDGDADGPTYLSTATTDSILDGLNAVADAAVKALLQALPRAVPRHQARILDAIGMLSIKAFKKAYKPFLASPYPEARRVAVHFLFVHLDGDTDEMITRFLEDPDEPTRANAAYFALKDFKPKYARAAKRAFELGISRHSHIFDLAAKAGVLAPEDLARLLRTSSLRFEDREAIVSSAWQLARPETATVLLDALSENQRYAEAVHQVLPKLPFANTLREYVNRVPDPSAYIAQHTAIVISKALSKEDATQELSRLALHPEPARRLLAISAAAQANVPLLRSVAGHLLEDPDDRVRGTASQIGWI